MGLISKDTYICIDCEATGLDTKNDAIIEVAAARFKGGEIIEQFDTLVDPKRDIPEESIAIHNITPEMVQGKPVIKHVLPELLEFVGSDLIVGHGVGYDIDLISEAANKYNIPCKLKDKPYVDTLRLARLYGQSPTNSLDKLREHFNIPYEGKHRALNDVIVNVKVYYQLARSFKTTEEMMKRLEKPISLPRMPLGKHKGRPFSEIPEKYLSWAAHKDFDQDLLYSIRMELKKRKKGENFHQKGNPFLDL